MAYRYRSLSKPTINILKYTFFRKPTSKPISSLHLSLSSPTFSRSLSQMGSIQSLLPLHSAVSSSRLISCLGIDSSCSRSLYQGMICSANPGVARSECAAVSGHSTWKVGLRTKTRHEFKLEG